METIEESIDSLSDFERNHCSESGDSERQHWFVCYEVFAIKAAYDLERRSWSFSTKGKENAFTSFWAERRSFAHLFLDEVNKLCGSENFFSKMQRDTEYYFLVPLRGKNRVLLSKEDETYLEPMIFLSGVIKQGYASLLEDDEERAKYAGPWSFLPRTTPAEYDPADYPYSIGLAYCNLNATPCPHRAESNDSAPANSPRLVRFLLPQYAERRELRGNVADVYMRYGQLWREKSPKINQYKRQYEEYIKPFDSAIDELYTLFHKRYVDQEYAQTTPLRHAILKKIKDFQRRQNWDTITKNNIYSIVFRNFATKLYKI